MDLTLPYRLFLLAYDTERERFIAGTYLSTVVRAGALAQLYLDGHLADDDGKAVARASRHGDPVLETIRREISDSAKPRRWLNWVNRNRPATLRAVRSRLDEAMVIRAEPHKVLGIFPATRVTLRDPLAVPREQAALSRALEPQTPVARVDRVDGLAAAFAAAGYLRTAITRAEARRSRARLAEFGDLTAPITKALHRAIQQIQSSG